MKTAGQIAYEAWHGYAPGVNEWPEGDRMVSKWEAVGAAVAAAEREACAKVCDEYAEGSRQNMADVCAEKIRMRSNVEGNRPPRTNDGQ